MKRLILLILTISSLQVFGQTTADNVEQALNAGSAKELVRYFKKSTEVKINDEGGNYTIAKAEPILREFFKENPPKTFDYIHKGQAKGGLKYNIGLYDSSNGSFRIVIILKEISKSYYVDSININKK